MTHHARVSALIRIASGLRLAADYRETLADEAEFRGDAERAQQLRRGAAHARAQADQTVRELAALVRAHEASPEHQAQRAELQRLTARDWADDRAAAAERRQAAEQRVAARRAAKADAAKTPPASTARLRRSA